VKQCKTHSRRFCWFCIGTTLGFPIEHLIWERAPLFATLSHALGL
jgi:hypothetical protein